MRPTVPLSRGVHHLALNTDDMKMTLDFYTRVLGMPLVHALKVPPGLGTGPGQPRQPAVREPAPLLPRRGRRLAARLLRDAERPAQRRPQRHRHDAARVVRRFGRAVFPSEEATSRKRRLPYLGPINVGCDTWSMYFYDPNGIRLEFSHQKESEPKVVTRWRQTKAEALAELRTLSQDPAWLEGMVAHLPVNGAARRGGKPRKAPGRKRSSARRTGQAARPSRRLRTGRRPARG